MSRPITDPELANAVAASVDRGEFATIEEARADFWRKLDISIAQADTGDLHDIENVRARLHERYANWPRAAE